MNTSQYHTRSSYEQLYGWLLRETGMKFPIEDMSFNRLILAINLMLISANCEPISLAEIQKIIPNLKQQLQ